MSSLEKKRGQTTSKSESSQSEIQQDQNFREIRYGGVWFAPIDVVVEVSDEEGRKVIAESSHGEAKVEVEFALVAVSAAVAAPAGGGGEGGPVGQRERLLLHGAAAERRRGKVELGKRRGGRAGEPMGRLLQAREGRRGEFRK